MAAGKFFKPWYLIPAVLLFLVIAAMVFNKELISLYGSMKGVGTVEASEIPAMLHNGQPLIVDVRTRAEYEVSHVPGAVWIEDLDLTTVPKDRPVIAYCTVGVRSTGWGIEMKELGYGTVYNLKGGVIAWKNDGREVLNLKRSPTDSVHVYSDIFERFLKRGIPVY